MIIRRSVLAGGTLLVPVVARATDLRVRLTTEKGAIDIALFGERAPITVANFLRYLDAGRYGKSGSFYRTVRPKGDVNATPINVIQGGLRQPDAPDAGIAVEGTDRTGLTHLDGTVSMARMAPGWATPLATSEFFVCIGSAKGLDAGGARNADGQGFAAFGKVVAGMDVVRAIHQLPTGDEMAGTNWTGQMLRPPVRFLDARRL